MNTCQIHVRISQNGVALQAGNHYLTTKTLGMPVDYLAPWNDNAWASLNATNFCQKRVKSPKTLFVKPTLERSSSFIDLPSNYAVEFSGLFGRYRPWCGMYQVFSQRWHITPLSISFNQKVNGEVLQSWKNFLSFRNLL